MLTKHEQKAKEIPPFNRDLIIYIGVICLCIEMEGRKRKVEVSRIDLKYY